MNVRLLFLLMLLSFGVIFYIGASTSPIILFVFSICIISFILSIYLTKWVLAKDEGPPEMIQISDAIRDGAEGFFKTQYGSISKMALLLAFIIFGIYMFRTTTPQQEAAGIGSFTSASITVFSFLLGAVCSAMAGYVGMWVSVRANVRVSSAARRSAREALQVLPSSLTTNSFILTLGILHTYTYVSDSCSCWWFLCLGGCWYGCTRCCNPLCHFLCLVGSRLTRFNEGY